MPARSSSKLGRPGQSSKPSSVAIMTNPLDDEVYGDKRDDDREATENGNPGTPQSELGPIGDQADTEDTRVAEQGD